jgi:hypothetical protein
MGWTAIREVPLLAQFSARGTPLDALVWWGFDDVPRHHRTVSSYVNARLDAGLALQRLNEPGPNTDDMTNWPRLIDQRRRPPFLVIRADKPGMARPFRPSITANEYFSVIELSV